ncbi:hypothetical protein UlMin_012101 [Ulmus minor]
MEARTMKTKGRQKIEIKRIEDNNKRHASFSKRKLGLFIKAAELSVLTGAELAVLVFSKLEKVFSFGSPSCETALDRYLYGSSDLSAPSTSNGKELLLGSMAAMQEQQQNYLEALNGLEEVNVKEKKAVDEASDLGFWWDRSFENMGLDELMKFEAALLGLKENVEKKSKELPSNFSSLPFDGHI